METKVNSVAQEALSRSQVEGFLCVDSQGLCVARGGSADQFAAGLFADMANLAAKLCPQDTPVVQIGCQKNNILLQSRNGITTVLYKKT